jgi:DNA repair exonuclease SbcCD nuclease subunit
MKIALTADIHLSSRSRFPERYQALENILLQLPEKDCQTLAIAGDLFNKDLRNHAEFDHLCNAHPGIEIHIIPGNHDIDLAGASFTARNVHVYNTPCQKTLDETGVKFLFLPYVQGKSMGEALAESKIEDLDPGRWVLIAHGDWIGAAVGRNLMEVGVYMPLTRYDLTKFSPSKVFLGHIHAPFDSELVHYIGSPCPMDISETGIRRFLVYDTLTGEVNPHRVETSVIYQQEIITILPVEDETVYLQAVAQERMRHWRLGEQDLSKVVLRVKVRGWSQDKKVLLHTVEDAFSTVNLESEPDLSEVSLAVSDPARDELVQQIANRLHGEPLLAGSDDPSNEQILQSALDIIYGR